jgi:hypothetical protein
MDSSAYIREADSPTNSFSSSVHSKLSVIPSSKVINEVLVNKNDCSGNNKYISNINLFLYAKLQALETIVLNENDFE